jgi:hypothetical protein
VPQAKPELTNLDRVTILSEALPYLQKFAGKTIVVKYGGAAMKDPTLKVGGWLAWSGWLGWGWLRAHAALQHSAARCCCCCFQPLDAGEQQPAPRTSQPAAPPLPRIATRRLPPAAQAGVITDLVLLSCVGIRPVLVHGGGPEINSWLTKLGIQPEFKNGLRVTDGEGRRRRRGRRGRRASRAAALWRLGAAGAGAAERRGLAGRGAAWHPLHALPQDRRQLQRSACPPEQLQHLAPALTLTLTSCPCPCPAPQPTPWRWWRWCWAAA